MVFFAALPVLLTSSLEADPELLQVVIKTSTGEPAGGARLFRVAEANETGVWWSHVPTHGDAVRRIPSIQGTLPLRASDGGRVALEQPAEGERLLVFHDHGYAAMTTADAAQRQDIRLQPWGKITGQLLISGQLAGAGETIWLTAFLRPVLNGPGFPYYDGVKTDKNGRFVFDSAPAGRCVLARIVRDPACPVMSHRTIVEVEGGGVRDVTVGAGPHRVLGRLNIDDGIEVTQASLTRLAANGHRQGPDVELPPEAYAVDLLEHGEFSCEGIAEGDYVLDVFVRERDNQEIGAQRLVTVRLKVAAPADQDPKIPIELGEIDVPLPETRD